MTLLISPDSWHYRFAERGGFDLYSPKELCFYTRRVIQGFLLTLAIAGLALIAGYALIDLALAAWFWQEPGIEGEILLFLFAVCGLVLGAMVAGAILFFIFSADSPLRQYHIGARITPKAIASTCRLVAARYRGWKDHYCPTIEIQERAQ